MNVLSYFGYVTQIKVKNLSETEKPNMQYLDGVVNFRSLAIEMLHLK